MPELFQVTATTLNLRRSPVINPANIIGKLGQGEVVQKIGQPSADWLQVQSSHVAGFAAARFLARASITEPHADAPAPGAEPFIPPRAHFPPGASSRLDSVEQRHCPLSFPIRARELGQRDAERCATLNDIVQLLDVEHSARYQPTGRTFCNIYAYDFCYLADVYLPRVWWTAKALLSLKAGANVGVVYGKTVNELTANALFDWLSEWGDEFGWQPCTDLSTLQSAANRGSVGVICAQRKDLSRSGHIVIVLPESPGHAAMRVGQTVVQPLQSQAGARNKPYFCNQWWVALEDQFRAHGFWTHS
jgi:hypothetical protein